MFELALRTLRFRLGGFVATFVAVFFGAAIVIACGGLLETGIRTDVPPQRLVQPIREHQLAHHRALAARNHQSINTVDVSR